MVRNVEDISFAEEKIAIDRAMHRNRYTVHARKTTAATVRRSKKGDIAVGYTCSSSSMVVRGFVALLRKRRWRDPDEESKAVTAYRE